MNIKIKDQYLQTVVAFGKSGLPLGERSKDELIDLAIMAQSDPTLAQFFEGKLPSVASLKKAKTDAELKALLPEVEETQPTEQEIIRDAVPAPFNRNTKVEELNPKAPSPGPTK